MTHLTVMTWNILHKTWCEEEQEHPWRERLPLARSLVERERPDVFCAQEAYPEQMDSLLEGLPEHWWFGKDRYGEEKREGCPIAYDTTRLKPLDRGQFWLGVAPDKPGSLTWVNDVPRILTWGRFEVIGTGQRFVVANTHLDHLVPTTRTKEIELLKRLVPRGSRVEPVILCGDFNSPAWAKPHRLLVTGPDRFHDTYKVAEQGEKPLSGTFHDFKGTGWARLDWILTRPRLRVPRLRIVRDGENGRYPSDHYPVIADVILPGAPDGAGHGTGETGAGGEAAA